MARPSRGFSESIGIWKCWFLRRGENQSTRRKTSRSKDENQQQTQPTFDAESGNRTRATLVGGLHGRQMLNHCKNMRQNNDFQTITVYIYLLS